MSETEEALQRELRAMQEMLAFVLEKIGEPVVVTKDELRRGLPNGVEIRIDEDLATESFVFSLELPDGRD